MHSIIAVGLASMALASLAIPMVSWAQTTSIQISTFGALPPQPQAAGTIRVLTNKDRGIWLSTGSSWYSAGGNFCNVKAFDAAGNGVTDDTVAIQRALDATQCGVVIFPAGTYKISNALALARDTVVVGVGKQRTVIATNSTTSDVFSMTGSGSNGGNTGRLTIRDLTIQTAPGVMKTGGVGIKVSGGASLDYQGALIDNVEIYDMPTGIEMSAGRFNIVNSQIWYSRTGIHVHNDFNQDAGNNAITNSFVFAGTRSGFPASEGCGTGNVGILITGSNDTRVAHNWIGAGDYGVLIDAQTGVDLADAKVLGNAIEGQCIVAIAVNARSQRVLFTVIANNEITSWGSGIALLGGQPSARSPHAVINGNVVLFNASPGILAQAFTGISVGPYFESVSISGNTVGGGASSGDVGYDVQTNNGVIISAPVTYAPVGFSNSNVALVQGGAYTYAALSPHVADGSYGTCIDCTPGGACAGGGNGAMAVKTSAGWLCK